MTSLSSLLPARLHHAAYVSSDHERTRHFYEDVLGLPLTDFWIEREVLGGVPHAFGLASYGLADGSSLSFFHFADAELQARYAAKRQGLFVHLALKIAPEQQAALRERLEKAGIPAMAFHHGYARSLYVEDPDGQTIELCVDPDHPGADTREAPRDALTRWLAGDRTVNNHLPRDA
ncbi:VOC family protein [Sphingomonas sp. ABOLD]|uniref:Catechol 2,3-dioxygenase-like lactoylglutathione lyase family enzyme n=1 Tax=Sphingomonas trueperi TaxID=53317 RepID=A0A7X5XZF2_9SPHN|nr:MULTISPECIES: VOC family protein [Sphingomonas]NJB98189.1 catechol 2,3-dioxygenase-like lactoylglutathione lyase family enzyme [Sphingomonas trueperi]RSV38799.1 VOC family protein [Sphingomonas sp. ABOLE]RSV44157.1 VOC family protein [Sphingomonas sp. ABOLD]